MARDKTRGQARAVSDTILPRPRFQPLFFSCLRTQTALRFRRQSATRPCMDAAFCRDRASPPSPNLECGQPLLDSLAAVGGSGPAPVAVDGSEPLRPPDEAPRNTAIRNWGEYAGPPCASRSRKWCVAAFSLSRPWAGIRPRMRLSALRLLTQVPTACPGLGRIDLDASHETILTSTQSGVCPSAPQSGVQNARKSAAHCLRLRATSLRSVRIPRSPCSQHFARTLAILHASPQKAEMSVCCQVS